MKSRPIDTIPFSKTWHERYGHLPWYRRYEFLAAISIVLLLYSFLLLPPFGRPDNLLTWGTVLLYYVLIFSVNIIIVTDREKPILLKRIGSISVVAIFIWLYYTYGGTKWDSIQDKFLNFPMLENVWPMYFSGLLLSLQLMIITAILAFMAGLILGVMRSLHNPVLELFLAAYVDFFRSMPLIALMMLVYYAMPFIGINLTPFPAAVTALALMNSAYIAEIIRSGIEAIHKGQFEAAKALGLHPLKIMSLVILPQTIRIILPPLTSNLVGILKDTSIAYVITLPELLSQATKAMVNKANVTPLIFSSVLYLIILLPLTRFAGIMESRSKKWVMKNK